MSDLQIGLLVIGAAAVAGVLIYNRVQERATRRQAEQAFGSRHADVLMDEPEVRREPTFEPPTPESAEAPAADPRIDYVVTIRGASASAMRREWQTVESRFPGAVSLLDAGHDGAHAALQMVSRKGVVSEADLHEFRAQVERMAAAHGASISSSAPEAAFKAAKALDQACAEVDVQIALHVLGASAAEVPGEGFSVARRPDGVTLLLDVARTADLNRSYAAMASAARGLGGRVVDDNGNTVDERGLSAIGAEVEALRSRMAELGIEPGSPRALRLFS